MANPNAMEDGRKPDEPSPRRGRRERAADVRPEDVVRSTRERAADVRPEDVVRSTRERAADVRPGDVMRSTRERGADVRSEDVMRSTRERGADVRSEDVMRSTRERGVRARPEGDRVMRSSRERAAGDRVLRRSRSGGDEGGPSHAATPSTPPLMPVEPPAAPLVVPAHAPLVGWDVLLAMAARFDPMMIAGGLDRAISLADRVRGEFFSRGGFSAQARELAACLAFECKSMQHCGLVAQGEDLRYLSALYAVVAASLG